MSNTGMIISKILLILAVASVCIPLSPSISTASLGVEAVVATPAFSPDAKAIAGLTRVIITCSTPGATIRYTTNGTNPTTTNGTAITSGVSVYVVPGTTLKAMAWATGMTASVIKSAAYTVQTVYRPYYIPYGTATVDGDLSEWVDVEWTPLTLLYDVPLYPDNRPLNPATPDIAEAYYAVRWSEDKVYVAIKVRDTVHKLDNAQSKWDACDLVEYCIHTTGTGPTDYNNYGFAAAQEYVVGIKPGGTSVWSALGPTGSVTGTGVNVAGKVVGQWFYHEAGLIPYQYLNRSNPSQSIISYLSAGNVIGVDPLVLANNGTTDINDYNSVGYTGMRSENMMTGKFMNYNAIGRHLLVMGGSAAACKACVDGTVVSCSGLVTSVFGPAFYAEATDRSSGIRVVKSGHVMSAGYAANVVGVIKTDTVTGERYIDAGLGTVTGAYRQMLTPLAMTNKSLGGSGVLDPGLDSIGLYVRTTGRVASKGTGWFTIEDGSGVAVKVVGTVPSGTPYVTVTGANSCEKGVGGVIQRRILATSIMEVAP